MHKIDFLSLFLPGVLSEVHASESGGGIVKPGEPLKLTCTVTGAVITDRNGYHWIRRPPNKGLEWIGRGIHTSSWYNSYASAFESRVSIRPDYSKNEFSLQLNSMKAADTAVYYCVVEHSDTEQIWHQNKKGKQEMCIEQAIDWCCRLCTLTGSDSAKSLFLLRQKRASQA